MLQFQGAELCVEWPMEGNNHPGYVGTQNTDAREEKTAMPQPSSISMQKVASLPALAAGLISPAVAAKIALTTKNQPMQNHSSDSTNIVQQLNLLNSKSATGNTSLILKTAKTTSGGQQTYVVIPAQSINANDKVSSSQDGSLIKTEDMKSICTTLKNDIFSLKISLVNVNIFLGVCPFL